MQPRRHEDTKTRRTHEENDHMTEKLQLTVGQEEDTSHAQRHDHQRRNSMEDLVLKLPSHLSDELEELIYRTIGCCITVHRALGPGLLETIYTRAICLELEAENISF